MFFAWESEGVLYDRDGTLSGAAGSSVAAWTNSFDSSNCVQQSNGELSVGVPAAVCNSNIKLIR